MLTESVKNYVNEECKKQSNVFGAAFFEDHVMLVADYSRKLAEKISADIEIVEISSYLHDISAVQDIKNLPAHNTLSAEVAERFLRAEGYRSERVEAVKRTIISHTVPLKLNGATPEEVCLSNADAMSQITRPVYWLYFVFSIRNLSYEEGRKWIKARVENNWTALIEPAKEIIEKEYLLVRELLSF
ncbi:MAG: HD domain-containing protein [Ignavibacteria bacterium]|jgi:uncharacterized protein|nr:HD domain-containing protein [Ignavibacteria bacterium]MCU7502963.1 HD domain-containing protein [Ignavibacteria bacterium]MCU7517054.1 HD domain-containing protein [Ignavibacteria bacterium]